MYINTISLDYPVTESQIKSLNPNVSFTRPFVPPTDYALVKSTPQPSYDFVTERLKEVTPVFVDNEWRQAWEVVSKYTEYTDDEGVLHTVEDQITEALNASLLQKAQTLRQQRDRLLQQSDWVVIRSYEQAEQVPLEWLEYRQALRDIPQQTEFPSEISWPTMPD
jgi:hypothetical protein